MSASPRPWAKGEFAGAVVDADGHEILWATSFGEQNRKDNIDLVVRAVNAHDELVVLLSRCENLLMSEQFSGQKRGLQIAISATLEHLRQWKE